MRPAVSNSLSFALKFQSTHLVWGATSQTKRFTWFIFISIHAPRVRCDVILYTMKIYNKYFNPRTSCEVRPILCSFYGAFWKFQSTHLVWGATCSKSIKKGHHVNFNPRTSCEVRQLKRLYRKWRQAFQSTHLVWGATYYISIIYMYIKFQSTHLVWGATPYFLNLNRVFSFQSTHLVWGATAKVYIFH